LERASWCRWGALQGAGAGYCLLSEWCVQFGAMLVALRVLLQVLPEGDI